MEHAVVFAAALLGGCLTLFSGFGFGTLMLPIFTLFFPVELAVAATAVAHFARQVFKLALIGRWADRSIVLRFAPPAAIGAIVGAWLLHRATGLAPLAQYTLAGRAHMITPVKAVMATLILLATVLEAVPALARFSAGRRWLPVGGLLSGFFGGLSGHQGALRMAFLRRWDLNKEALLGTSAVCAIVIDVSRIAVYGAEEWRGQGSALREGRTAGLIATACVGAFFGSYVGARLVKQITMGVVQGVITGMLILTALLLGAGLI